MRRLIIALLALSTGSTATAIDPADELTTCQIVNDAYHANGRVASHLAAIDYLLRQRPSYRNWRAIKREADAARLDWLDTHDAIGLLFLDTECPFED
jgi:hypothetical protein